MCENDNSMLPAIWLNENDIRSLLPMPDLLACMRVALRAFSQGGVKQPVRTVIEVDSEPSFFATMPVHAPSFSALGAKLVTVFPANSGRPLPSHLATVLLLDSLTGTLLAIMDGRYLTEARTAAVSAVAADLLANPTCRRLAILGSGVQARSHLEALPLVRKFDEIRCWSPTPSHLHRFITEARHPALQLAHSAEAAVRGADLVVLATSSLTPVIQSDWVQDGACVISVGACRPNHREMDPALVGRAHLFVDSRTSALQESGDIVMGIEEGRFSPSHIVAEIGELLDGMAPQSFAGVTIFKSLGLAIEDVSAAQLVHARALELNKGMRLA